MNRLKSPIFWGAMVTNILLLLKTFGYFEQYGITETSYQEIVISLTAIINAFGIANNPTSKSF